MLSTGHGALDDRIYYKETLSLLSKLGGDIVVVASGDVPEGIQVPAGVEFLSLGKWHSLWSRFSLIPKAAMAVLRMDPEVCHLHDFELLFVVPFLRLFSKCKIIYDDHEVYYDMALESNKLPGFLRRVAAIVVDISERILSRCAHHVITPTEGLSERFRNFHKNVTTIYNYPRTELFCPDNDKVARLKQRYKDRVPILYQGTISEDRGLFSMIEAMQIMKAEKPEIILLLLGAIDEGLFDKVEKRIETLNIRGSVDIIGLVPHEEVVNYMAVSRVGLVPLFPTRRYVKGIPNKQFEYMACGLPVLGGDLPLISSYINTAGCGKIVDSTNPADLAAGVVEILKDETEWKRMSEAGKRAAGENWNWNAMEKRLFLIYEELLGTKQS